MNFLEAKKNGKTQSRSRLITTIIFQLFQFNNFTKVNIVLAYFNAHPSQNNEISDKNSNRQIGSDLIQ